MKAITTKYHGPTEHRGSRIIAKDEDGKKFILSEFGQFNHDDAHRAAAEGLRDKMGWRGDLIGGGVKGGMVWVFTGLVPGAPEEPTAENLLAEAAELQSQMWDKLNALESLLGIEIDSTNDLSDYSVDDLIEADEL